MKRSDKGRALFYTRDSGGKHEQTPAQYVGWAQRKATELGLTFDGTPDRIDRMMKSGLPFDVDLFFDFGVQGNKMSRPALDALRAAAQRDLSVSHILIPRRNRLARPDDPLQGLQLEEEFRRSGITLVFMDRTLLPIRKRDRRDMAETLVGYIEYDQNGQFLCELADKMVSAQIGLANAGYSTGGRAPFGFRRTLVRADGTVVRPLANGEVVRQKGNHVVWIPGPKEELDLIFRILEKLERMPANRVAALLTAEGVPSPDAGRTRKDNGVTHAVSGVWHQSTVVNIARNPLLLALMTYGRRSMGEHRRFTPEGPRLLDDADLRQGEQEAKPRVIRNPTETHITAPAPFEPLVDVARHRQLLADLDSRAGTQRGKSRSRDPGKNPLGGRIYDMNCSWPMYRNPTKQSFRYVCGCYQQTHGQKCAHNHIGGPEATKFLLSAVRQRLLSPAAMERLQSKIREKAEAERVSTTDQNVLNCKREELEHVRHELRVVESNLARAANQHQYDSISATFDRLKVDEQRKMAEVAAMETAMQPCKSSDDEVDAAMRCLTKLPELASDSDNLPAITELFNRLNVQLYLSFRPQLKTKRVENKLVGGIWTCGDVEPPIQKYQGATSRRSLRAAKVQEEGAKAGKPAAPGGENVVVTDLEGKSLGNVSRGERSFTEQKIAITSADWKAA